MIRVFGERANSKAARHFFHGVVPGRSDRATSCQGMMRDEKLASNRQAADHRLFAPIGVARFSATKSPQTGPGS